MCAAVGQRRDDIVTLEQLFGEVQITIHIIQYRQVNHAVPVVGHQLVIGIFGAFFACSLCKSKDAFFACGFIAKTIAQRELHGPSGGHQHEEWGHINRRRRQIVLRQHRSLKRRVGQFCLLLIPRQSCDFLPAWLAHKWVHRAAPVHNDADTAQANRRDQISTIVIGVAHPCHLLGPRHLLDGRLQHGEGDGHPCLAA